MAGKLSNIRIKELPEVNLDLDLIGQVGVGLTQLPDINVGATELPRIDFQFGWFHHFQCHQDCFPVPGGLP